MNTSNKLKNTITKRKELSEWTEDDFRNRIDELLDNYDEEDEDDIKEEIRRFIEINCNNLSARKWKY